MVGFCAAQKIVKRFENPSETAIPMFFEDALDLFRRRINGITPGRLLKGHAEHVVTSLSDDLVVVVFDLFFPLRRHIFLHSRQDKVGCALKNSDLCRCLGDLG